MHAAKSAASRGRVQADRVEATRRMRQRDSSRRLVQMGLGSHPVAMSTCCADWYLHPESTGVVRLVAAEHRPADGTPLEQASRLGDAPRADDASDCTALCTARGGGRQCGRGKASRTGAHAGRMFAAAAAAKGGGVSFPASQRARA